MSVQQEKLKAIADAIREKDGTTEPIAADDFPERIRAIEASPEPTVEERLYPYAVYRATRPTDWPEMPEPGENEICIYVRRDVIESDATPNFLCWLQFTGNGVLEVSYSRTPKWVEDGVPSEVSGWSWDGQKLSRTVEQDSPQSWGITDTDFEGNDNIIRFQFKGTLQEVTMNSGRSNDGVCEIWCNLPDNIDFKMAVSAATIFTPNLKYFKRLGDFASGSTVFTGCKNLISVLEYPTLSGRSQSNMFYGCENLEAAPPIMFSDGVDYFTGMIRGASKLKNFPLYSLSGSSLKAPSFAQGCSSLQRYPQVILDKSASFVPAAINGCTSLRELRFTDKFALPSSGVMSELEILTFNPETTTNAALTVNIPKMGYINFKTMLLSLPINNAIDDAKKTFTVTLSEETKAQVTDDDYAICTEKGWILTIT